MWRAGTDPRPAEAFFFVILNNLSRQEGTQLVSLTLISVAGLISLYALYQFLTKSHYVLWTQQYPGYVGRGSGTYVCPNHLAGLLEMVLPLGLAYTLTGRFKPTAKVFLGYAALAIFTGIGVSVSRGAWLATGLGLLFFFGLLMRQRGYRLAGVIFCVLLIGAFAFFLKNLNVLQRRVSRNPVESKIDTTRLELWRPAYQMWRDHFWWGVGPAQFDQQFRHYRPEDIQMRPLYAHNDYLNALADWAWSEGVWWRSPLASSTWACIKAGNLCAAPTISPQNGATARPLCSAAPRDCWRCWPTPSSTSTCRSRRTRSWP